MGKLIDNELNIEIDEQTAEGTYSNLALIAHSSSEFVIDFVNMMPGNEKALVKSRIVLVPENAKRLMLSLQDNINRYEQCFGDIKIHATPYEQVHPGVTPMGEA